MARPGLNLRHFFALPDIVATGRLSAAAEHVHLSQSALTQALRKLEAEAGTALFQRLGHGVKATEAGAILERRARRAIDIFKIAERELGSRAP